MPNCFQLTLKGEKEPRSLNAIDNEFWVMFEEKIPELNNKWYLEWYNILGLGYAMGISTEKMVENCKDSQLKGVAEYIHNNYNMYSWYEGKR